MPGVRIKSKRGGAKKLSSYERAMREAPELLRGMSRAMADESVARIKDGFRTESDPYGRPWAPKKVPDGRKVLSGKTSRLKGGWHVVKAGRGGFVVAPSVNYAVHHQFGTRHMPRRRMVPSGRSRGLPRAWRKAFEEAATEAFQAHFAKAAKGGGGASFLSFKISGLKRRFAVKALIRRVVRTVTDDAK